MMDLLIGIWIVVGLLLGLSMFRYSIRAAGLLRATSYGIVMAVGWPVVLPMLAIVFFATGGHRSGN